MYFPKWIILVLLSIYLSLNTSSLIWTGAVFIDINHSNTLWMKRWHVLAETERLEQWSGSDEEEALVHAGTDAVVQGSWRWCFCLVQDRVPPPSILMDSLSAPLWSVRWKSTPPLWNPSKSNSGNGSVEFMSAVSWRLAQIISVLLLLYVLLHVFMTQYFNTSIDCGSEISCLQFYILQLWVYLFI